MNIKSFMAVAVAALTLAACDKPADDVAAPVEGPAGPQVEPNVDGSVVQSKEVSEDNPAHLPN